MPLKLFIARPRTNRKSLKRLIYFNMQGSTTTPVCWRSMTRRSQRRATVRAILARAASGCPPGRMKRLWRGSDASSVSMALSSDYTAETGKGAGCQRESGSVARAAPMSKRRFMALWSGARTASGIADDAHKSPSHEFSSSAVP